MFRTIAVAGAFALGASAAQAAIFTYQIGDIDGFGGDPTANTQSVAEASATNGAQWTDISTGPNGNGAFTAANFPLPFTFAIDDFASITSITLGVYALGIQSNDSDPMTTDGLEDALDFEGDLVAGFFEGVDQGSSGQGLISASLDPALFLNALDGSATFTILLNSFQGTSSPAGEPAAFDYFTLTIDGELATSAAVPLPAAAPLLLAGLGGLAALRRRR